MMKREACFRVEDYTLYHNRHLCGFQSAIMWEVTTCVGELAAEEP